MRILTALIVLLAQSPNAWTCSVYGGHLVDRSFVVGKNFDWHDGTGLLVQNPRGAYRQSLVPGRYQWQARYQSLSFTTLGPGYPVSAMNERGLVVEALVDLDYRGGFHEGERLYSLEWAQYVLDQFPSTEQAIEWAARNPFAQIVVPVHFFICDSSSSCAVVEIRDGRSLITTGTELRTKVLANRAWQIDYELARNQPGSRFARLMSGRETPAASIDQAFQLLDTATSHPVVKWQILWQPESLRVDWRNHLEEVPSEVQSYVIAEETYGCFSRALVRSIDDQGAAFSPINGEEIRQAMMRLRHSAGQAGLPPHLEERIQESITSQACD